MTTYTLLGVMSGSSLDGLDLALTEFQIGLDGDYPTYRIVNTGTLSLPIELSQRLSSLPEGSLIDYFKLQSDYNHYLGVSIRQWLNAQDTTCDGVAIHGHTVYHNPEQQVSIQMDTGGQLSNWIGIPVLGDFRTADMAHGGQGAPLAHMGDNFLWPGYQAYLNLGGIANLSIITEDLSISFDLCGANQILNRLASKAGVPFDDKGNMAASGQVEQTLLNDWLNHPYVQKKAPKSLDNQYTLQAFYEPFAAAKIPTHDLLATAVEAIAQTTAFALKSYLHDLRDISILACGGGTFNEFLILRIQEAVAPAQIVIPNPDIVDYKEAIFMGYLGALRLAGMTNCLGAFTGAHKDTINGYVYLPS